MESGKLILESFLALLFSLIEAKIRGEMKGEVQCPVRLTLRTENLVEIYHKFLKNYN